MVDNSGPHQYLRFDTVLKPRVDATDRGKEIKTRDTIEVMSK